jgi:hypothetical protein
MSVDTENKRRSVSGYTGVMIPPRPDATIDAFDREEETGLYAGIAAGAPTPPPTTGTSNYPQRRKMGRR